MIAILLILTSCAANEQGNVKLEKRHEKYDDIIEEFFLADLSGNFEEMEKYLNKEQIEERRHGIELSKKDEDELTAIKNPEVLKTMGEAYRIKGFDLLYEDYKQILYEVSYYQNGKNSGNEAALQSIYGLEEVDGEIRTIHNMSFTSRYDSLLDSDSFKKLHKFPIGSSKIDKDMLKKLMEDYPEHTYITHDIERNE